MESYFVEVDNVGLKWRNVCWDCMEFFRHTSRGGPDGIRQHPCNQKNSESIFSCILYWIFLEGEVGRIFCGCPVAPSAHKITTTPSIRFLWSICLSISGSYPCSTVIEFQSDYWVPQQVINNLSIGCWIFDNWLNWSLHSIEISKSNNLLGWPDYHLGTLSIFKH